MGRSGRPSLSLIHTGFLLLILLLTDFLWAVPLEQNRQEEAEGAAASDDMKAGAVANLKKLVRNRRNVPVLAMPQFQRVPDFWGWYKYFMDSHNQEGVEDLDRLYLAYLQNKHRSEEGPSFNHYLKHLSEIYRVCADSDDPECISESTSKPKASVVMPASIRSGAIRMCNPYIDPYCPSYPLGSKAAAPKPELAPAKVPAPVLSPFQPMKSATGSYYYAPVLEPFLNAEQRNELLRICRPDDVECLQYHLRSAFGYRPVLGSTPSYAALHCNPKDPYCLPSLVQKAPTGFYHHLYPSCDPAVDPLCGTNAGPAPLAAGEAPREQQCNPLFDKGCNPLTATRLASFTKPIVEYSPKGEPGPPAAPLTCDPRTNPYCILAAAAALRRPPPQLPEHQVRYQLGVHGKTKEGYDCYVSYDKDCTPVKSDSEAPSTPFCHPYDPKCFKFTSPSNMQALKSSEDGVILPDPDCDPEYDYNCRLRHNKPASEPLSESASADEPIADEKKAAKEATVPRFEDFLQGFISQHK